MALASPMTREMSNHWVELTEVYKFLTGKSMRCRTLWLSHKKLQEGTYIEVVLSNSPVSQCASHNAHMNLWMGADHGPRRLMMYFCPSKEETNSQRHFQLLKLDTRQ